MLARQLVEAWAGAPEHPSYRQPGRPDKRDEMLRLLRQLGEAVLLGQFIADVVTWDYDGSDNAELVPCARLLGARRTGELYADLMREHFPRWHGHCTDLLHDLTFKSKLAADKSGPAALRQIAEAAVSKLDEVGKQEKENEWMSWRVGNKARPVNAALVANLLDVLGKLDASELRVAAAERFAAWPAVFDPVTILVPALGSLHAWDDAATRLWQHGAEFLLQRSGRPPEAPADWRQDVNISDCACADCLELQAFALDPVEHVHHFRVRQTRRSHLEQQIIHHSLNMATVTDRKGSPQSLVCTKDRRSYQRRCAQYRKDIAALAGLAELAERNSAANKKMLSRIAAARALADEDWEHD